MATRPSQRVRVQTDLGSPQLQVVAQEPFYARARSNAADNARALEAALGIGGKVFEQGYELAQKDGAKDAAADFTAGKVDDKRRDRNKAYNSIITKLETEAAWVDDEKALDEHLNTLDLDNISSEDLDNEIKGFFRKNYLNANGDELQVLAPKVAEKRMKILQSVSDRQQQIQVSRRWGEVAKIFERDITKVDENGNSLPINWDKYNELSTVVNGNANATEALFGVVSDAAIRAGRPDLLRSVPSKWPNGAQSWLDNPLYTDKLRAAEAQALRQKIRNDKAIAKGQSDAEKAAAEAASLEIAFAQTSGQDTTEQILKLQEMPGIKSSTIMKLNAASRSAIAFGDDQAADPLGIARLRTNVLTGRAGLDDVLEAFQVGLLGRGKSALSNQQTLLGLVRDNMRRGDLNTNNEFSAYRSDVERRLTPVRMPGLPMAPEDQVKLNDGLRLYNRLVKEEGLEPYEASQRVFKQFNVKDAPLDALTLIKKKSTGAELRGAGVTSKNLSRLHDAKDITDDEYKEALTRLLSTTN